MNRSARAKRYDIWYFGDTEEVAKHCAERVCAGIKTATSGLVWKMEADGEPLPEPGDLVVVTGLRGEPRCIVEVTECVVKPFAEVDAQFAFDYGEGDMIMALARRTAQRIKAP